MFSLLDFLFTPRCVFCERILGVSLPFRISPLTHKLERKEEKDLICPHCHPEKYRVKPPYCPLCGRSALAEGLFCESCSRKKPEIPGRGAYLYDGFIKDSLHRLKFEGRRRYAPLFGKMLYLCEKEYLEDFAPELLVPVPLYRRRLRDRGFNQAEDLCKALFEQSGIPYANLLVRGRYTEPQMNLNALLRFQNLEGAFGPNPRIISKWQREGRPFPKRLILVDDIFTTGSTVAACAKVIRAMWPETEIRFLTFALTPPPENASCAEREKRL